MENHKTLNLSQDFKLCSVDAEGIAAMLVKSRTWRDSPTF